MTRLQQTNGPAQGVSGAEREQSGLFSLAYLIYLISFLPYLCVLFFSVFGLPFSFMDYSEVLYGMDAVTIGVILLCTIPVLPAALIYEVVFLICSRKTLTAKQKKTGLFLALGIILSLIASVVFHRIRESWQLDNIYRRDSRVIEAYLQEEFGAELAAGMQIRKPAILYALEDEQQYHVETPLLGDSYFVVWVNQETKQAVRNNFVKVYEEEKGLAELLAGKLAGDMGLSEDTKLCVRIDSFDPEALLLPDAGALLESCEYTLDHISFRAGRYDREKALSLVGGFYRSYGEILMPHTQSDFRDGQPSFHFYVLKGDDPYVSIYARVSEEDDRTLLLFLCGCGEEAQKLISREEVTLHID